MSKISEVNCTRLLSARPAPGGGQPVAVEPGQQLQRLPPLPPAHISHWRGRRRPGRTFNSVVAIQHKKMQDKLTTLLSRLFIEKEKVSERWQFTSQQSCINANSELEGDLLGVVLVRDGVGRIVGLCHRVRHRSANTGRIATI